jgi:hypothetical protein
LHHSVISPFTLSVIRDMASLDTISAVDFGDVRGDLADLQTLCRQRQYDLIDLRQPTLTS